MNMSISPNYSFVSFLIPLQALLIPYIPIQATTDLFLVTID